MKWITVRHRKHGGVARVAERSLSMWQRYGWEKYEPAADQDTQPTSQPQARSTSRRRGRTNQPQDEE